MGTTEWGNAVTSLSGFAFLIAAVVALMKRKPPLSGYLAATGYVLLFPIHLWFWQFQLTQRGGASPSYIVNGIFQIVTSGIVPLIWLCFRRKFRPMVTALAVIYAFSLLLQLFSYIYWAHGTTRNFNITLSHLDSFYFALGTLTTAGTGNISAISETARGIQTWQMGLSFILIGFVVALVVSRYSNLLTRTQPELPHDGIDAAKPAPAVNEREASERNAIVGAATGLLVGAVIAWPVLRAIWWWLKPEDSNHRKG